MVEGPSLDNNSSNPSEPSLADKMAMLDQMKKQELAALEMMKGWHEQEQKQPTGQVLETEVVAPVAESVSTAKPSPEAEIPCPKCGRPDSPGANFCGWCGFDLKQPIPEKIPDIVCPSCQRKTGADGNFCDWCGFKLK